MERHKAIKYYKLAKYFADLFSKDPRTKVGAICIDPNTLHIRSMGYNGFPRKLSENEDKWSKKRKYPYVAHAEENMICNASLNGVSLQNSILVCTMFPCSQCAKLLIQSGITTIISKKPNMKSPTWGESFRTSQEMLKELNINIIILEDDEIEKDVIIIDD